ncbi:MAG TPA: hypothetical protein VNG71_06180 [Pyrinomonadaceae bacterium]|nr:hypothetical protein [Pyrinomonadaceae bacterium]
MPRLFADVVEDVKQLSPAEKEELQELLRKYLIEERCREIREKAEAGLREYREGKLEFFSNVDDIMNYLSN